jgi:hypothetical protein
MEEIERLEIDPDRFEIGRTIASIDESTTVQIGEGKDRLLVRASPRREGCGECTFCCTALGINELQKLPMTRCRHVAGKGCGIYPNRPKPCQEYACGWLLGNFDARFRPDRVGASVTFYVAPDFGFYAVVVVNSAKVHHKRLRQLLDRLFSQLPEIRVIYDDKHGSIYRHGQPPQRFRMMERPPGDYENALYLMLD